ncbi:hypothetical protein ARSQ2_02438 [Arsenophonus endosymbiont of Bemisia tabaci Q2]|nr:hypothetical protein ARSQ2_02438 [Arsenophonus endosymbiont of Bemisia tabaci Q2]
MNNEQGRFEINHEHPLVKYAEKVFVTTDDNILANIAIRLHDSISNMKMYFDENHDIYFATAIAGRL